MAPLALMWTGDDGAGVVGTGCRLCLLHLSRNFPDVDAGDGVDVVGGGALLVVHLVGLLLLLFLLSVEIFNFHANVLEKPVEI